MLGRGQRLPWAKLWGDVLPGISGHCHCGATAHEPRCEQDAGAGKPSKTRTTDGEGADGPAARPCTASAVRCVQGSRYHLYHVPGVFLERHCNPDECAPSQSALTAQGALTLERAGGERASLMSPDITDQLSFKFQTSDWHQSQTQ